MTCRELMTPNPAFCVVTDNAVTAAMLMKSNNVGSLPVVADRNTRKLVGIITDRDLALRVVAEQRDYYSSRVDQVMSTDVFTCKVNDDFDDVTKAMAKHQVRRVPVVDGDGRLLGIIAQADIVREASQPERAAKVVEKISAPTSQQRTDSGAISRGTLYLAGGLSVGAGLLYLIDPRWAKRTVEQISAR